MNGTQLSKMSFKAHILDMTLLMSDWCIGVDLFVGALQLNCCPGFDVYIYCVFLWEECHWLIKCIAFDASIITTMVQVFDKGN